MIYQNIGRREVGKTTLALYLTAKQPLRVMFDPRGLLPAPNGRISTELQLADAFSAFHNGERKTGEIVITPDGRCQPLFEATSREVKYWLREDMGRIAFLVDEVRFLELDHSEDFDWVLRCAPRDAATIVLTAHRPKDISVDIRAISDVWCMFHMTQKNDLDIISDRCSPRVAELVAGLRPREFIAWDDSKGDYSEHRNPDMWFLKLSDDRQAAPTSEPALADTATPGEPRQAKTMF